MLKSDDNDSTLDTAEQETNGCKEITKSNDVAMMTYRDELVLFTPCTHCWLVA